MFKTPLGIFQVQSISILLKSIHRHPTAIISTIAEEYSIEIHKIIIAVGTNTHFGFELEKANVCMGELA